MNKISKDYKAVSIIGGIIIISEAIEDFTKIISSLSTGANKVMSLGFLWDVFIAISLLWIGISLIRFATLQK